MPKDMRYLRLGGAIFAALWAVALLAMVAETILGYLACPIRSIGLGCSATRMILAAIGELLGAVATGAIATWLFRSRQAFLAHS
jgi:hypothetical protein